MRDFRGLAPCAALAAACGCAALQGAQGWQLKPLKKERAAYLEQNAKLDQRTRAAVAEGTTFVGMPHGAFLAVYGEACRRDYFGELLRLNYDYAPGSGGMLRQRKECRGAQDFFFHEHRLVATTEAAAKDFLRALAKKNEAKRRRDYAARAEGLDPEHRKKILSGGVALGMTAEDVLASWGEPSDKSKKVNTSGWHETWSYGAKRLRFDNGRLIDIGE